MKNHKPLGPSATAELYGFTSHAKFIDFIGEYYPDLYNELENQPGWDEYMISYKNYMPKHLEIIDQYLKSDYVKISFYKLSQLFGYRRTNNFRKRIREDYTTLYKELVLSGYDDAKTMIIPLWITIIIKHLGEPDGIEEYKK